jgi:prolyl 4-hydroxylase
VLEDAGRLFGSGQRQAAVALVERAAATGDGEALYALANWRLYGLHGPRDLAEMHRLLAAAEGHRDSVRLRATLVGNGTGIVEDAAAARALLAALTDDPSVADELALAEAEVPAPVIQRLSVDPAVVMVRSLLSVAECAWLISKAAARLQPSSIVDPATGRRRPHPFRTSLGTNFGPAHEDLVVRRINRRIAEISGTEIEAGEPLHVLAYAPGQEYRPHLDALPGATNQRTHTMLVWLNDDFTGGETVFPALGLTLRGRTGDALLFVNLDAAGRADERMRHAGLPPASGRKWLASRWIRARPLSPFGP